MSGVDIFQSLSGRFVSKDSCAWVGPILADMHFSRHPVECFNASLNCEVACSCHRLVCSVGFCPKRPYLRRDWKPCCLSFLDVSPYPREVCGRSVAELDLLDLNSMLVLHLLLGLDQCLPDLFAADVESRGNVVDGLANAVGKPQPQIEDAALAGTEALHEDFKGLPDAPRSP